MSCALEHSERIFSSTEKRVPSTLLIAGPRVVPVALDAAAGPPAGRSPAAVPRSFLARASAVGSFRICALLLLSSVLFIVLPVFMAAAREFWPEALTTVLRAVDLSTVSCNRRLILLST